MSTKYIFIKTIIKILARNGTIHLPHIYTEKGIKPALSSIVMLMHIPTASMLG